ncbi:MAG: NAD(P)/FAD-dependent oxidoreductase [Ruminiclostridium sp.]|nr:NAD(P)/FAD-dependent oxidoreductase [Ruminiclostridium sp.]
MNIAIIGAGMSGLSCAIILEQNGISATIFEKRSMPGDRFVNGETLLHILSRPINKCLDYFSKEFNIRLEPTSVINQLTIYSENKKAIINGDIGYTNIRGRHRDSFENQLAAQVKSHIIYHSEYTLEQLKKEFTHIVLATGDAAYAEKLGNYRRDLTVTIKGATVEGSFKVDNPYAWLNYKFAPKGYAYLIPFSEKEANIVIGYPDYPENKQKNLQELWKEFYEQVCKDISQNLRITDNFEISNYIIGICNQAKLDNIYHVGNNFGCNMPALGFGQFESVLTGVYAAYDLSGIGKYESLTKDLRHSYKNSLVIRRALENMDNNGLDLLVQSIDNWIADKVFDTTMHIDFLSFLSRVLKPFLPIHPR